MLSSLLKKNLDKIEFSLENPIEKVGDLWVFSVTDPEKKPLFTLFYEENGFRIRDEATGAYKQNTALLKNENYRWKARDFFGAHRDDLMYVFDAYFSDPTVYDTGFWEKLCEVLNNAKANGSACQEELKSLGRYAELGLDNLPSLDTIKAEIVETLKTRLVVDNKRVCSSPCGEDFSIREYAEMMVYNPITVVCPKCGKRHYLFNIDSYWEHRYLKLFNTDHGLFLMSTKFDLTIGENNEFTVLVDEKRPYDLLRIWKGYDGLMKHEHLYVCNGKASVSDDAFDGRLDTADLINADQACAELEAFGEYGHKMNRVIEHILRNPNKKKLSEIFTDTDDFPYSFLAKLNLEYLLDDPEDAERYEALLWANENRDHLSFIRKEKLSYDEIIVLKTMQACGKNLTHDMVVELRRHISKPNFKLYSFNLHIEKLLKHTSLIKLLKYMEGQDYDFGILEDYWGWLRQFPGNRMADHKAMFPQNLKLEHDITRVELDLVKEEMAKQERVEKDKTLLKNWCSYHDDGYVDSDDEFVIAPFDSLDQIDKEAEELHICINMSSYTRSYLNGDTLLCAVRKKDNPTTPFVAVEIRDGRLVQARAKYNHQPDSRSMDFIHRFCDARGIRH